MEYFAHSPIKMLNVFIKGATRNQWTRKHLTEMKSNEKRRRLNIFFQLKWLNKQKSNLILKRRLVLMRFRSVSADQRFVLPKLIGKQAMWHCFVEVDILIYHLLLRWTSTKLVLEKLFFHSNDAVLDRKTNVRRWNPPSLFPPTPSYQWINEPWHPLGGEGGGGL